MSAWLGVVGEQYLDGARVPMFRPSSPAGSNTVGRWTDRAGRWRGGRVRGVDGDGRYLVDSARGIDLTPGDEDTLARALAAQLPG